jgi:2-polyprenyl-6-methoxyphenol hydroxylase-like FAD-dependent oxidoreductase
MSSLLGTRAIVVGAGMGGLTAARALADHFERVLVLERDALPGHPADRVGVPQGHHVHALLAGGQRALEALFPGFEGDLVRAGAVPIRAGLDVRTERPGYDPFPQRDLGWDAHAMSRALLEFTVRQRLQAIPNVEIRQRCRADEFVARGDGAAVTGVRCTPAAGGDSEILASDLVVDSSGRGTLTLDLLRSIGMLPPEESAIGVDVGYASAIFAIPADAPTDWKGVFTFPRVPHSSRGALLLPLEGKRWIVTVAGRYGERPPGDAEGFMAFARELRTPTIHKAIERAKRLGEVARARFPASVLRHYDRLRAFPRGVLPLGDAVCRFNPIYGQGMSVAAQEAQALSRLLAARAAEPDPLGGLALPFFAEAAALIDTPWFSAAIPDFVHPDTTGDRPPDLAQMLAYGSAVTRLAARDPAVHTLTAEVQHLLKPRSVYREPEFVQRVLAVLADAAPAAERV